MNIQEDRSRALALAGGAMVTALLETLVAKDILSRTEVRAVLLKAISSMSPYVHTSVGYEASGMIAAILRDRFPGTRQPGQVT